MDHIMEELANQLEHTYSFDISKYALELECALTYVTMRVCNVGFVESSFGDSPLIQVHCSPLISLSIEIRPR